jgi:hypothetical protein
MTDFVTYSSIEFDVLAVDPKDIQSLRDEFAEIGPARIRSAYKERGGDWTTLWVVVTFVGLEYARGVISKIAEDNANQIQSKLRRVFAPPSKNPLTIQNISIKLSFDDIELTINLPRDAPEGYLARTVSAVHEHISAGPLADTKPRAIVVPIIWGESGWEELSEWYYAGDSERYWGIGEQGCPAMTAAYDRVERRLFNWFEKPPSVTV